MSSTVIESPTHAVLAEFISEGHAAGDVVTIFARCSVKYTGCREGEIADGERVIVCKGDGAVTVHRPTGARAVARQGIGSSFEVIRLDDNLLIYGGKGDTERIRVWITDAAAAVRYDASDDALLQENQIEEQMHEYILPNPDAIEDGFRIIEHERSTPHGRVTSTAQTKRETTSFWRLSNLSQSCLTSTNFDGTPHTSANQNTVQ